MTSVTVSVVVLCTLNNYIISKCIPDELLDMPVITCEL
jgi:hypothetical protein